jgi:hypothetical protein
MKGGTKVPKPQSSRRSRSIHHTVNKVRSATLRSERDTFVPSENLRQQIAERDASEYEREAAARARFLKKGATLAELLSKRRSSDRPKKSMNRYVSAAPSPSKSRASPAKKVTKKAAAPTRRSAFGKDAFANMLAELGGIKERSKKYHESRGAKKKGTLSAVRENNANNEM